MHNKRCFESLYSYSIVVVVLQYKYRRQRRDDAMRCDAMLTFEGCVEDVLLEEGGAVVAEHLGAELPRLAADGALEAVERVRERVHRVVHELHFALLLRRRAARALRAVTLRHAALPRRGLLLQRQRQIRRRAGGGGG